VAQLSIGGCVKTTGVLTYGLDDYSVSNLKTFTNLLPPTKQPRDVESARVSTYELLPTAKRRVFIGLHHPVSINSIKIPSIPDQIIKGIFREIAGEKYRQASPDGHKKCCNAVETSENSMGNSNIDPSEEESG